jgi:hypothetical protein
MLDSHGAGFDPCGHRIGEFGALGKCQGEGTKEGVTCARRVSDWSRGGGHSVFVPCAAVRGTGGAGGDDDRCGAEDAELFCDQIWAGRVAEAERFGSLMSLFHPR